MTAVVRLHKLGGPDVLAYEDIDIGRPGPGQVRIRQGACGLNFIDTYFRSGLYAVPLPCTLGNEGAGEVVEIGPGVQNVKVGDRVTAIIRLGGYAAERIAPAERLIKLPPFISDEEAAAVIFKGLTAQYLLRRTFRLQPGHTVLFHAAAGGVGLIACQWARLLGATVIGTVGSKEKAELAKAHGCHHTILYREEDFVARVREITKGALCDVVYDGVARAVFPASLDCLKPRGAFVNFGNASGALEPFDPMLLHEKGSLWMTKTNLFHYNPRHADLVEAADELFEAVRNGVRVRIGQKYALKDAAKAHRDLESRATVGSTILIP
jgi:NADPH2:quinone reductase